MAEIFADNEIQLSKRSVERFLDAVSWLETSSESNEQLDGYGRSGVQMVFSSLLSDARRKRRKVYFASLHAVNGEPQILGASGLSSNKPDQPDHVLVVQDGRGAKKWMLLQSDNLETINSAFEQLCPETLCSIFSSGRLVELYRDQPNFIAETAAKPRIHIVTSHFSEPSIKIKSRDTPIVKKPSSNSGGLTHLDRLEAESIHIIREVMAHADNPVMLYSVGKDSSVMLHLARKAFYPSRPPFPLLHVDTRWKFKAMYEFRDTMAEESGMDLIVHINPEGVEKNINPFDHGSALHTDIMKTQGLKQALDAHKFDVAFGGARRDEEKSRAKERIFSFRSKSHRWDPKNQRPEIWNIFNCRKNEDESVRVFPLSNWTELDIWQYIYRENIPIVPLYYAAERPVVRRNGMLIMVDDDRMQLLPDEAIETNMVRFRTLGCYPLTGAVESTANNLSQIVLELLQNRTSEREGRAIDSDSGSSMEKKKQEGYF
ncbi:MAG: sulfate adenylyltransferase subunit CysD [Candidatus Azotimanducaceae bacterium]